MISKYYFLLTGVIAFVAIFSRCSSESQSGQRKRVGDDGLNPDTLMVTSSKIERNEGALKNWTKYEIDQESIALPQGWKTRYYHDTLVFTPPSGVIGKMRVAFLKYAKAASALEVEMSARRLALPMATGYSVQDSGHLRKLEFRLGYCYLRDSIRLSGNGEEFQAQVLSLVDDSSIRKYEIILDYPSIASYQGDFFADVIGNLRIKNSLIMSDNNSIKKIISFK